MVHNLSECHRQQAAAGGLLAVAFAVLAQMMTPKRLAGVLAAAPSVALGSLTVTVLMKGSTDAGIAARGMVVGAIAFTVYCLVAVPALRRWGLWWGSMVALVAWGIAASALFPVVGG
jgi:hypothetical protein